jgi:hypothetical protein
MATRRSLLQRFGSCEEVDLNLISNDSTSCVRLGTHEAMKSGVPSTSSGVRRSSNVATTSRQ